MPGKILNHYKRGTLLKRSVFLFQDIKNMIRYGPSAPKFADRIWLTPGNKTMFLTAASTRKFLGMSNQEVSVKVIEFTWPVKKAIPVYKLTKIKMCIEHWRNGKSWEDTGIYKYMEKMILDYGEHDGCRNIDDLKKRYENLDLLFEQARQEGRLRTWEEVNPGIGERKRDSGFVHVGPRGILYWGGPGQHRLAIAYILNIPIPAQIGCVHINAIPYLHQLREFN